MSMVFQSYAIFPHLNVFENIAYGLNVQHRPRDEIKRAGGAGAGAGGADRLENRAPNQLSGGQQQRVALARALVMEPKVLLMDEPLSNLDAKLREQMRTEIRRIQKRLGITSVYVTHDQIEAMTLSDQVVVMNKGKIEQVGTPDRGLPPAGDALRGRFHRAGQFRRGHRARPAGRPAGAGCAGRHVDRA